MTTQTPPAQMRHPCQRGCRRHKPRPLFSWCGNRRSGHHPRSRSHPTTLSESTSTLSASLWKARYCLFSVYQKEYGERGEKQSNRFAYRAGQQGGANSMGHLDVHNTGVFLISWDCCRIPRAVFVVYANRCQTTGARSGLFLLSVFTADRCIW